MRKETLVAFIHFLDIMTYQVDGERYADNDQFEKYGVKKYEKITDEQLADIFIDAPKKFSLTGKCD